ncbi:hypothetical protein [Kitasatospora azatica]|uniref:hypothetical protein n=1 Tax=Kitasatospora azatica TaxID=58347 RepID=UPI0012F9DC59|nr:hypothetical protein [Kitasatospora azatica]
MKRLIVAVATAFAILVAGSSVTANAAQARTEAKAETQSRAKLDKRFVFEEYVVAAFVGIAAVLWANTRKAGGNLAGVMPKVNSIVALNQAGINAWAKWKALQDHISNTEILVAIQQKDINQYQAELDNHPSGSRAEWLVREIFELSQYVSQHLAAISLDRDALEILKAEVAAAGEAGARTVKQ